MNDAAQNNIVMMNPFDRPRAVPGTSMSVLNDCRDMAASGLDKALSQMMDKATDDLFELSEQTTHYEMRNLYMEAMTVARERRDLIEAGFRQAFIHDFNREARSEKRSSLESDLNASELSLVEPDDLEESLASINISNGIHGDCAEELFGLEKRMGMLLRDPDLLQSNNPLGPEVIANAFMKSLKALDCPVKVKLLLVNLFTRYVPRQIKGIYQEINQYLVDKGVLSRIRVGMKKQVAVSETAVSEPTRNEAAAVSTTSEGGLFAALQQLLARGMPGSGARGSSGGGANTVSISSANGGLQQIAMPAESLAVVSSLTQLQHGQLDGLGGAGGALDAAALTDGKVNVLREIRSSPVASSMGHVDAMTLDIVAMLFDYILDDRRIPDAMKALIGRLQIPVLKVAMLDKSFFSQKSHPARKLLDRLAEVSIGWDETEGHQCGLYQAVDGLIQRILNEFDDKVGMFAEVLENLENYLAEEKKRTDERTGLSAHIVHQREQEEISRIMAHDEARRRVQAPHLPEVIRGFLAGCWENVLAAAYIQTGEDGASWNQAIVTMDELVWSVEPKSVPEDRKKLVGLLPGLLKRLQEGMAQAGLPDEERDQFFSRLVQCHAVVVKAGLQPIEHQDESQPGFVEQEFAAEEAAEMKREDTASADFAEISVPQEASEPDPVFMQTLVADSVIEIEEGWQTFTIGDANWQGVPSAASDDYDAMVKRLKRGTWIEIEQEKGTSTRVKLAWVSPLKGLFLFTNRLGERAVSITPEGLAEKFRNGVAHVIDDVALVDRAVNNLMERLKQNTVEAG
ncbi:MAG: DUF1631 domain-containing protein [Sulfuricella denitrificans]|nr:DUF1631 domain-containing protein [Sulfuricella denitrificans]